MITVESHGSMCRDLRRSGLLKPVFLLLLMLSAAPAFAAQAQDIAKRLPELERMNGRFSFVVLGDNRSGDAEYKRLISMAMEKSPAFIVNTGDQIPDPGDLDDWAYLWEMSRVISVPYFLTVGNHDVNDKKSEQIYKDQVDLPGNELYYSFAAGNSLFVVLDSYLTGEQKRIEGKQYRWLESVLSGSSQRYKFVFLHHPLYPDKDRGRHYGNSLDRYPADRDRLQDLFVRYKVSAVFTGHEHLYLRKDVGGIPHITTGGGGAPLYAGEKEGGFHHFILVTIDGEIVSIEVIDINGRKRDSLVL